MTNLPEQNLEKPLETDTTGSQKALFSGPTDLDWTKTLRSAPTSAPLALSGPGKRSRTEDTHDVRDFSSLTKSDLIAMVKNLQEQNLLLTRCLANSQANHFTVPPVATQKETFVPSASLMLSKHAPTGSQKEFPPLPKGKSSSGPKISSGKSFSKVAQTPPPKKTTRKASRKATPQAKEWAIRLFQSTPDNTDPAAIDSSATTGYTFVYLPSNKRTSYTELRDRLKLVGINLNRVYSLGRPARNVISLLIHQGYETELLNLCKTAGVKPITDFNPTSGATIGDPELIRTLKSDIQKEDKAKSIYYNNLLRATVQLRNPKLGLSILNYFRNLGIADRHYVPETIVQQFIKLRPQAIKVPRHNTSKDTALGGFDAASIFESLTPPRTTDSTAIGDQIHATPDVNADPDTQMNE